ncbi:TVP38/TMEM64 family protein [Clostridium algidicarnis]|nr:TVP38/TMEM64 family protein [Clostridium algidicarnis]MBU3208748.1 TVP38/TMEM64 family protein [Clostridium algidicarnis]MBU3226741.1 TVP38/TMEM64 family protein [Clostridium algidicarnis]MBU3250348.1 TVP38/TMEM64 family protein [Clostridium algidicarnis]
MNKKKRPIIKKILVVVAIVSLYFLVPYIRNTVDDMVSVLLKLNVESAKDYILSFGIWAPIISFLLMILQSIAAPLPAFIITFANAGLFGWWQGAILSWVSAMAGSILCFYISKLLGREVVEKLTSKFALESIDDFFEKHGKYAILIARLLPFISFDLVSYAAGLTSMGFWSFFWATGIGQLPATIIYSYVGGMLVGGTKKLVFGLLILFALSVLIYLIKRVWNEKNRVTQEI